MSNDDLCPCGNKARGWLCEPNNVKKFFCDACDPDPDVDASDVCMYCGAPSDKSGYAGDGVTLGICNDCDEDGDHPWFNY
jgi:hypothetical protein